MGSEAALAAAADFIGSDACRRVVVLTGAGVSVAAGIPDFRSPGGMYETLRPE
jgi:NAD-dependent SIR2 family protein deacetylase